MTCEIQTPSIPFHRIFYLGAHLRQVLINMGHLSSAYLQCQSCGERFPISIPVWRCHCCGLLDVKGTTIFPRDRLKQRPMNLWRYREALALPEGEPHISLGEVMTPLLKARFRDWDVSLKLEYMLPTGSYKDRGIAVCMNHLSRLSVRRITEDSSGNAGASTAAYAAAAGIRADVYVPDGTSPSKVNQIRIYGAQCQQIPGTRLESAQEAQRPREGTRYIGHSWNPLFACGIKSVAYEIAEQSDWKCPDWIVTPVGGGSLVMGLIDGFNELLAAGYVQRLPRILAVQSVACAPIYQAWCSNESKIRGVTPTQTCAEGIALPDPPRGTQVLQALLRHNAAVLAVDDEELLSCWRDMARIGIAMEPTSAVAVAGAWLARGSRCLIDSKDAVVILVTGHGLKTKPILMSHCQNTAS